jgi:hypothetical protein
MEENNNQVAQVFDDADIDTSYETLRQNIERQKNSGKSIDIVDKTPEAEDLINGAEVEDYAEDYIDYGEGEEQSEPEATPEEAETAQEKPEAPKEEPKEEEKEEIVMEEPAKFDAEHAFDPGNDEYFRITREKLASLRRERNETIVKIDKAEDELTALERENSQFASSGNYDKVNRDRANELRKEIRELHNVIFSKNHTINTLLGVLRAL